MKIWRNRSVARALAVCLLSGVLATQTVALPEDGPPHVVISTGDALAGTLVQIFEGDEMRSIRWGYEDAGPAEIRALQPGAYLRLRGLARQLIQEVPAASDRDIPCQDYGVDAIGLSDGEIIVERVVAFCPEVEMQAAQDRLRAALDAEVLE